MKNKQKLWRKMAKKKDGQRNGRLIKQTMQYFNSDAKIALPIHIALFKRAGIATPAFDASQKVSLKSGSAHESSDITDIEFTEGTTNAA
jgi:hypothetical protein